MKDVYKYICYVKLELSSLGSGGEGMPVLPLPLLFFHSPAIYREIFATFPAIFIYLFIYL